MVFVCFCSDSGFFVHFIPLFSASICVSGRPPGASSSDLRHRDGHVPQQKLAAGAGARPAKRRRLGGRQTGRGGQCG